ENRNLTVEYEDFVGNGQATTPVGFTEYLGVAGLSGDTGTAGDPSGTAPPPDYSGILVFSDGTNKRKVNFASITDGSSNTLMIGERPPSADLFSGWWFAGAGFDGSVIGDVVMGARELRYCENQAGITSNIFVGSCPLTKMGFQPGHINDD